MLRQRQNRQKQSRNLATTPPQRARIPPNRAASMLSAIFCIFNHIQLVAVPNLRQFSFAQAARPCEKGQGAVAISRDFISGSPAISAVEIPSHCRDKIECPPGIFGVKSFSGLRKVRQNCHLNIRKGDIRRHCRMGSAKFRHQGDLPDNDRIDRQGPLNLAAGLEETAPFLQTTLKRPGAIASKEPTSQPLCGV